MEGQNLFLNAYIQDYIRIKITAFSARGNIDDFHKMGKKKLDNIIRDVSFLLRDNPKLEIEKTLKLRLFKILTKDLLKLFMTYQPDFIQKEHMKIFLENFSKFNKDKETFKYFMEIVNPLHVFYFIFNTDEEGRNYVSLFEDNFYGRILLEKLLIYLENNNKSQMILDVLERILIEFPMSNVELWIKILDNYQEDLSLEFYKLVVEELNLKTEVDDDLAEYIFDILLRIDDLSNDIDKLLERSPRYILNYVKNIVLFDDTNIKIKDYLEILIKISKEDNLISIYATKEAHFLLSKVSSEINNIDFRMKHLLLADDFPTAEGERTELYIEKYLGKSIGSKIDYSIKTDSNTIINLMNEIKNIKDKNKELLKKYT